MKLRTLLLLLVCLVGSVSFYAAVPSLDRGEKLQMVKVTTTQSTSWQKSVIQSGKGLRNSATLKIDTLNKAQVIDGFGACFNEKGWTSLSLLVEADRKAVMRELFAPGVGACFTICRMPIGANDFSRNWYSYNEVDGDFEMYNFTIDNDKATLIPFIKEALKYNPSVKIWASPWCPPTWMKHNRHYASKSNKHRKELEYRNGLPVGREGKEGTDMFILEPEYLKAYALYFKKFIQCYRKEGIAIYGVMPQNEFNSPQVFPSCCWTAKGLATFIGKYLGPAMKEEKVDVLLGTMERANYLLVDSVLRDAASANYIKAVGMQWAGKDALPEIHKRYPSMKLYQTEQECGNGKNDWKGLLHSWNLLKHYLANGVSVYDYWNISLKKDGVSRWGWRQNSLVVVDDETKQFAYTLEYYLMKHIAHFVKPGAYNLQTEGSLASNSLTFVNPDGSVVILVVENEGKDQDVTVRLGKQKFAVKLSANSMNTLCIQ